MSDSDPVNPIAYEPPDPERPATASPPEPVMEAESPVGFDSAGHDPYAALRSRDYSLYSLGWIISVIGQQVQETAIGYEIYTRTNSKLAIAWVGLVLALPVMLLALPAGHLADRFDRKRVVMLSEFFAGLCSLGLAAVSLMHGPIWLMYGLLALSSIAHVSGTPARASLLPQIVPARIFNNAVTWNSSFFQIASMAGPALGGFMLYQSGGKGGIAYLLVAACALIFVGLLTTVRLKPIEKSLEPATFNSLVAGVRFVWRTKIILATITLDLFAVLLGGAVFLLPVFAKDILRVDEIGFGWLRAAPAIGAFVAALLIAHLPPMKRAGRAMLWSVAGFGMATIVFGLSPSFWLSFVMLALTGGLDNVSVVVRHTLVQMLPPDAMRGRVAAVNTIFIGASNELGGLESGLTAWAFGTKASVVGGGIGTILVVIAVSLIWPQVRRFGSLKDVRPLPEMPKAESRTVQASV